MIDDAELVRTYSREGSEEAFRELVRRHIDVVYSAAHSRLGNDAHLSADVVQQVFVDLARKAGSLSIRSSLVGWLFVRARYLAADRVRAERQRRKREQAASIMQELSSSDLPPDEWRQLRPILDEALGQLGAETCAPF